MIRILETYRKAPIIIWSIRKTVTAPLTDRVSSKPPASGSRRGFWFITQGIFPVGLLRKIQITGRESEGSIKFLLSSRTPLLGLAPFNNGFASLLSRRVPPRLPRDPRER